MPYLALRRLQQLDDLDPSCDRRTPAPAMGYALQRWRRRHCGCAVLVDSRYVWNEWCYVKAEAQRKCQGCSQPCWETRWDLRLTFCLGFPRSRHDFRLDKTRLKPPFDLEATLKRRNDGSELSSISVGDSDCDCLSPLPGVPIRLRDFLDPYRTDPCAHPPRGLCRQSRLASREGGVMLDGFSILEDCVAKFDGSDQEPDDTTRIMNMP